jgi:serine/threonine-protein kinase RIM15
MQWMKLNVRLPYGITVRFPNSCQDDIILMEFKLPQINGEDVARMIRTSKNPNSSTPIVAVTGYLKDLADPQHFDELVEKPATPSKLIDVLERQCFWKPPSPERPAFGERKESLSVNKKMNSSHDPVERFIAARAQIDDDAISVASSTDRISISRSTTHEWDRFNLGLRAQDKNAMTPPQPPDTVPLRLQTYGMERIPSPLSTYVSTRASDKLPPPLPSPPEMIPLPPSIAPTPAFGTPALELSKSPLSRSNSPPAGATLIELPKTSPSLGLRFRPYTPAAVSSSGDDEQLNIKPTSRDEKSRSTFANMFSSGKDKEATASDQDEELSTSPSLDFKNRSKRSSLEKKKERQGKQRKEGLLGEEADADDEDSLSGGRKPSKSRSISEIFRGVKRSPPEMKRTKSNETRDGI